VDFLVAGDLARLGGRARLVRVAAVYWHGGGQVEITTTEGVAIYVPVELVHRIPEPADAVSWASAALALRFGGEDA
jgi:hypothetical protein